MDGSPLVRPLPSASRRIHCEVPRRSIDEVPRRSDDELPLRASDEGRQRLGDEPLRMLAPPGVIEEEVGLTLPGQGLRLYRSSVGDLVGLG